MAWDNLISAIEAVITSNANNEITGEVLKELLVNNVVPQLGSSVYAGIANTSTNPNTPQREVFYMAYDNGVYSNFSGITLDNEVCFLIYKAGSWVKEVLDFTGEMERTNTGKPVSGEKVFNFAVPNSDLETNTNILDYLFDDNTELNPNNLTGVSNNDTRVSKHIEVYKTIKVTTSLWKSSGGENFSSCIVGYEDNNSTNPVILLNANDLPNAVGVINLVDYEISIPTNITHVRIPNRKTANWSVKTVNTITDFTNLKVKDSFLNSKLLDVLELKYFEDNTELNNLTASNLTGVANNDTRTSKYLKVYDKIEVTTSLWKSSGGYAYSSCIVGYENENGLNPIILLNPYDLPDAVGVVNITDYEINIPPNITHVRIPNRKTANWSVEIFNNDLDSKIESVATKEDVNIDIIPASEIKNGDINNVVTNVDNQLTGYLPVNGGEINLIDCVLWKSSSPTFSTSVLGFSDDIGSGAIKIIDANNFEDTGYVILKKQKIFIPYGVNYVRINNKVGLNILPKIYKESNSLTDILNEKEIDLRGEMIINNASLASIEGQAGEHDSQILVDKVNGKIRVLVIYRTITGYYLNEINQFTKEIVSSHNIANTVGWSPRMYKKDDNTIRLVYTINKLSVYYKDFSLIDGTLGAENTFKVAIKVSGVHDTPQQLTVDRFLEHVANVSGIDYRDSAYNLFASRNMLIEDTQQIQNYNGRYWLTAEVLADSTPSGDTGGIACLISSTDLDTWVLHDPISIKTDLDEQRDHEVSATFLNGKWHALTRQNKGGLNIGAPSGYQYYTSTDGENWTDNGLLDLPTAMNGIRHGVYKTTLQYAQPFGVDSNKFIKTAAILVYQKTPKTQAIREADDTSHKLRTELGLCYTLDFKNFIPIANITDRANINYPSITMYADRVFLCWTSGAVDEGSNFSSIMWSSYNLGKI